VKMRVSRMVFVVWGSGKCAGERELKQWQWHQRRGRETDREQNCPGTHAAVRNVAGRTVRRE
jgi:hypothetical protein